MEGSKTFIQAWGTDAASSSVGESLVVELFLAAFSATLITREVQRGLIKATVKDGVEAPFLAHRMENFKDLEIACICGSGGWEHTRLLRLYLSFAN